MKHIGCPDSTRPFVNFINSSVTDNRDGGYGYLYLESNIGCETTAKNGCETTAKNGCETT